MHGGRAFYRLAIPNVFFLIESNQFMGMPWQFARIYHVAFCCSFCQSGYNSWPYNVLISKFIKLSVDILSIMDLILFDNHIETYNSRGILTVQLYNRTID